MGGDITAVVPAGLPNILGKMGWAYMGMTQAENRTHYVGAFYYSGEAIPENNSFKGTADTTQAHYVGFNASLSSSIYGSSSTVQPPALSLSLIHI